MILFLFSVEMLTICVLIKSIKFVLAEVSYLILFSFHLLSFDIISRALGPRKLPIPHLWCLQGLWNFNLSACLKHFEICETFKRQNMNLFQVTF